MNTMLQTAQDTIRLAAKHLGYDDDTIEAFLKPEHVHKITVKAGGKSYPALRVQQGGGKGGVVVDPRQLSAAELEELSRDYARQLAPFIGSQRDIPAPDVNTNAQIIGWMSDELAKVVGHADPGAFTGKPLDAGGSEGRTAATGYGGMIVLGEYLRRTGQADKPLTVALQGFGNVGYYFAASLGELPNLRLIAVANSQHTWLKPEGINASKHSASGDPRPEDLADLANAKTLPAQAIIGVEADILVLAALEDAVTDANVADVKARVVVELANGPVTQSAEQTLQSKKVTVLPDVVANAGGVIVSCLEWQQNLKGEHWPEDKVNEMLRMILMRATHSMLMHAESSHIGLKQAAFELALKRLLR